MEIKQYSRRLYLSMTENELEPLQLETDPETDSKTLIFSDPKGMPPNVVALTFRPSQWSALCKFVLEQSRPKKKAGGRKK